MGGSELKEARLALCELAVVGCELLDLLDLIAAFIDKPEESEEPFEEKEGGGLSEFEVKSVDDFDLHIDDFCP